MNRTNWDTAHAAAPFRHPFGARLRVTWQQTLAWLRATARRMWTSGMGVFLLVLLVIAGSVSILVPSTQEGHSTTPILSTATPTPVVTATPTAVQRSASARR